MQGISVSDNLDAVKQSLRLDENRLVAELPRALNFTAAETRKALVTEMERVFDRPTRWTLNGMFIERATADNPTAAVFFKEFASKGLPAGKYLRAEIEGGTRRAKRSERALAMAGLLGNKGFWVPARGAPLDAYGNIPGPVMVRILAELKAFGEVGYVANKTAASAKRNKRYRQSTYFVPQPGSSLAPGVWQRVGKAIKPILLFVSSVNYHKRFDFYGVGRRFADEQLPRELSSAVRRAFRKQLGIVSGPPST